MELPLPFLVSYDHFDDNQELNGIEQYDNTDNLLPLPIDSNVIVEVNSVSDEKEYGVGAAPLYYASYLLRSRGFNKIFRAKYLDGTRLIELPDQIQISINYDEPATLYDD